MTIEDTTVRGPHEPGTDLPPRAPRRRSEDRHATTSNHNDAALKPAPNAVMEAERSREQMVEEALCRRFGEQGRAWARWYRAQDLAKEIERPSMLAVMAERERAGAGADLDELATKHNLEKAVTRLEGSHALLKWMVGFTLAFVVAIAWRVFV